MSDDELPPLPVSFGVLPSRSEAPPHWRLRISLISRDVRETASAVVMGSSAQYFMTEILPCRRLLIANLTVPYIRHVCMFRVPPLYLIKLRLAYLFTNRAPFISSPVLINSSLLNHFSVNHCFSPPLLFSTHFASQPLFFFKSSTPPPLHPYFPVSTSLSILLFA